MPRHLSQIQGVYYSGEEEKSEKLRVENDEMCFDIWKHI